MRWLNALIHAMDLSLKLLCRTTLTPIVCKSQETRRLLGSPSPAGSSLLSPLLVNVARILTSKLQEQAVVHGSLGQVKGLLCCCAVMLMVCCWSAC